MSKELEDCRDQIKTMRINAGLPMPCRDEFLGPGKFGAGSARVNQCPHKVEVVEVDPYAPTTPNVFNGGEGFPRSGPKPRGLKQLTPTYPIGTFVNASSSLPTFSIETVCPDPGRDAGRENNKKLIRPLRHKTTAVYRPSSSKKTESYSSSARGGVSSRSGYNNNKRKIVEDSTLHHKQPRYDARPVSSAPSTSTRTLAPSERYNFYRFYGYAGQGAKTSNGWQHGST
ncbi:unnamed protein product [Sphagnum troendelagicum]|uniref:Uncharacterized protein n=1 Tax=Sphagnum troendelagicum TaxID=128251 RepID=A0ABP0UE17_9BRYO